MRRQRGSCTAIVGLVAALVLSTEASGAASGSSSIQGERAGVYQLVHERAGRRSCWGVVIRLNYPALRSTIQPSQIEVHDAKHDSDLRGLMEWRVDETGRRLTVQFKDGKGDFGSGNSVRVCLARSAFREGREPSGGHECWQLATDLQ